MLKRRQYHISATLPAEKSSGRYEAVDLRYTVTATSFAHALATFWSKYARRTFAVDGEFRKSWYRDDFPLLATIKFLRVN
jgi:hypothetical protein